MDICIADTKQHAFEPRDGGDEGGAGLFDFCESLRPIGFSMRPSE